MQGRHFDCRFHMELILGALIQHSVWNEQWSNTEHDQARLGSIMYFLIWQNGVRTGRKPFSGRNLYVLLYMASFIGFLQSKGGKNSQSVTTQGAIDRVMRLGRQLAERLTGTDHDAFLKFCDEYTQFHKSEVERHDEAEMDHPVAAPGDMSPSTSPDIDAGYSMEVSGHTPTAPPADKDTSNRVEVPSDTSTTTPMDIDASNSVEVSRDLQLGGYNDDTDMDEVEDADAEDEEDN